MYDRTLLFTLKRNLLENICDFGVVEKVIKNRANLSGLFTSLD